MNARVRTAARVALLVLLASVLSGSSCSWAFTTGDNANDGQGGGTVVVHENATFGGWDLGPTLGAQPGVISVRTGWGGSSLPFLGEELVSWTGHRHVTQVHFDPEQTTFAALVRAARAARANSPRVTVYTSAPEQHEAAAAEFPADTLPRLQLRKTTAFTAR
ncbi:MAG TPA: hypothetical protein VFY71_10125 [Planctomycetota bacterium]|nr:hypothetical protein [Planctomycetota bacterium]